ncbi:MAG: hypothetical protein R3F50_17630 [Gammaproteobacteria bacterium]
MKRIRVYLLFLLLGLSFCTSESYPPFEFFYNITGEKAVVISILPVETGVEMHTRVYPEDGQIGVGEVASRDDSRILTLQEAGEVRRLFTAVDFTLINDGNYIPPLDASLWAVNTRETAGDYYSVLEPGEAIEERNLSELVALGTLLWNLAELDGMYY